MSRNDIKTSPKEATIEVQVQVRIRARLRHLEVPHDSTDDSRLMEAKWYFDIIANPRMQVLVVPIYPRS